MADKRITDLPLILSGDISSLDVLPIVNVELDITNKVTADQLKAYINSGFTDVFVTGGTYNTTTGDATFTNNTGGTFSISGFYTGSTDVFVTGGTYSAGTATFTNNTGGTFNVSGFTTGGTSTNDYLPLSGGTVTGDTVFTQGLTATTISATTYQNLPLDVYITGSTYSNNTFTFTNNTGGTFDVNFDTVTGLTSTGTISSNIISATTYQNLPLGIYGTGLTFNIGDYNLDLDGPNGILDTINLGGIASDMNVTGGTYNSGTGVATFTNNTGGTFNVNGFLVGYTDHYVTGFTYDNINTFNIYDNSGSTFSASITTLSATTISGGTLYGDGSNLTGISTQDTRITGFTYDDLNNLTIFDSTGGTFSVNVDVMSALTVTNGLSGGTISITNTPVVSVSPTYILSRNSSTGEIEFTAYSAITRTIDPFNNIGSASTITWNVSGVSANYEVTLTANTTLNISNVRNGDYGTIIVKQDAVGSRTITFGTINGVSGVGRHKVSNGGSGTVFLTSNANAVDLLTFAYNGTNLYWTIGNDYT
jgi:hypothetical protein